MAGLIVIVVIVFFVILAGRWWIGNSVRTVNTIATTSRKNSEMNSGEITKRYYVVDLHFADSVEEDIRTQLTIFKIVRKYPSTYTMPLSITRGVEKTKGGKRYMYFDITTIPAFHKQIEASIVHLYKSLEEPASYEWRDS